MHRQSLPLANGRFFWNDLADGRWQVHSAGSKPAGYVHPLAIRVMQDSGHDLSTARSKSVDEFAGVPFDLVITVCENARDACPVFPHATATLHWPLADPAAATGSTEGQELVFRHVRDQIRDRIASYLDPQ